MVDMKGVTERLVKYNILVVDGVVLTLTGTVIIIYGNEDKWVNNAYVPVSFAR